MLSRLLLSVNTVIGSGEVSSGVADAAEAVANTPANGGLSTSWIVIYMVVIFGAMYFMSIRPQRKREKQLQEMRAGIKIGDSVLCNTGMYGKIVDITAECYIIEFGLNKGVRVPVIKNEVAFVREPNLSNKEIEAPAEEKKGLFSGLFGGKKAKAEDSVPVDAEVVEGNTGLEEIEK